MSKLVSGHYLVVFLSVCLALAGCAGDSLGTLQVTYQGLSEGYEAEIEPGDYTVSTTAQSDGVDLFIDSIIYDAGGTEISATNLVISNANYNIPANYVATAIDTVTVLADSVTELTQILDFRASGLDGINVGFDIIEGPSTIYAVMSPGPSLVDNENVTYTAGFTNPNGDVLSGGIDMFCIDNGSGGTPTALAATGNTKVIGGVDVEEFAATFAAPACAAAGGSPLGLAVTTVTNGGTYMAAIKSNAYYTDDAARRASRQNDPGDKAGVTAGIAYSSGTTSVTVTVTDAAGGIVANAPVAVYNKERGTALGDPYYNSAQTDVSGVANIDLAGIHNLGELNAAITYLDGTQPVYIDDRLTAF